MKQAIQSRMAALRVLERIVCTHQTLMTAFNHLPVYESLSNVDKQFCRLLVLTTLRHFGQLTAFINMFVIKPLPAKRISIQLILALAITQIYYLKTPPHAAVDTSVCLVREIKQNAFAGLINGVLRSFVRQLPTLSEPDILLNLPSWLRLNWETVYGSEQTRCFIQYFMQEAPLDISVKSDAALWAEKLNGVLLPTGSIRCTATGDVSQMPGYNSGEWWVQEASASIPAQLFKNISGQRIADLCAAPGGKTAQLANQGAFVDAFDISSSRLKRLTENMNRLNLNQQVHIRCLDVLTLKEEGTYDAVLLDAPCSATGTIRRHPDLMFLRSADDISRLANTQKKLLQKAIHLTKKGGQIVYATCSLQETENESVVQTILKKNKNIYRLPLENKWRPFFNKFGAIQVLPSQNQEGFYAVLLGKK